MGELTFLGRVKFLNLKVLFSGLERPWNLFNNSNDPFLSRILSKFLFSLTASDLLHTRARSKQTVDGWY